jgi:hypothetical protein
VIGLRERRLLALVIWLGALVLLTTVLLVVCFFCCFLE